jgi:MSHA biogenesis protein MshQ
MSGNVTVSTALTLTSGIVTTNGYSLINSSATCATTRTNGWVNGLLQLAIPATNPVTCTFPVGDSLNYTPISITKTGTNTGTLIGSTTSGDHADTVAGTSGIDVAKSVNRVWTLTAGTLVTGTPYSSTLSFVAGDVDSGATTANFAVALKASGGTSWATQIAGTKTATSTQALGITSFGDFAVGEVKVSTCYTEAFTGVDGSAPSSNWSVGSKTGAFGSPAIYSNRLRLTDASGGVATWATLQRLIPAAGNKVTLSFDYYGYGSVTGADGIAMILSDASIAPAAGAFGGSLGYAQKSNPGSDCTTTGGCPGFAGGWLGIGFDEYGNYSANTEGRYGGAAAIPNSVAIRGSGSGMSGYRFLKGTAALSPTIALASAPANPDNYSVVIDHTDGIHAYVSVTRKPSGSSSYTTLLGCPPGVTTGCTSLDVKDPGYSQSAVPVNFNLSFTGSTGGSINFHEIDNLNICTVQGLVTPTLHHIQVTHSGTACTTSPASVTIKACADATCTSLYQNSVTVTLTSAPGGTWSPVSPVTFTGGSATVTLSDATAHPDTLTATATSPIASSATVYSPSNSITFAACAFDAVEVGAAAYTPIYTKLAGTAFNLNVWSLAGTQTPTVIELVDASSSSLSCSAYPSLSNTTTTLSAITAATPKTFGFTYNNAAPNVRVRITKATAPIYSCSTDNFAIRPSAFTLTAYNAANALLPTSTANNATPVANAGVGFSLQAASGQSAYAGTPKLNGGLLSMALSTLTPGSLTNVAFAAAVSGLSTASGLTYSEVGNFVLGIDTVYDDSFTAVDSTKAIPECTSDFNNGPLVSGRYGCMFGNTVALTVARFVPDHFDTVVVQTGTSPALVPMACASTLTCPMLFNGMVYSGQPFTLKVTAKNAGGGTTVNYDNATSFAKKTDLTVWGALGTSNAVSGAGSLGVLSAPAPTVSPFLSGVWTLTGSGTESYTFTTAPTTPTDIYIRAIDTDTPPVSSLRATNPTTTSVEGGVKVVSGRIKIPNAYGSDLLPLTLTAAVQYYSAAGSWVTSTKDSGTPLAGILNSYSVLSGTTVTGTTAVTKTPNTGKVSSGLLSVYLGVPTPSSSSVPAKGTVTIAPTTTETYLPITPLTGTATFGVYKGNSNFIYMRESY